MPVARHSASSRLAIHGKFQTATYYSSADEGKNRGQSLQPEVHNRPHNITHPASPMKIGPRHGTGHRCREKRTRFEVLDRFTLCEPREESTISIGQKVTGLCSGRCAPNRLANFPWMRRWGATDAGNQGRPTLLAFVIADDALETACQPCRSDQNMASGGFSVVRRRALPGPALSKSISTKSISAGRGIRPVGGWCEPGSRVLPSTPR